MRGYHNLLRQREHNLLRQRARRGHKEFPTPSEPRAHHPADPLRGLFGPGHLTLARRLKYTGAMPRTIGAGRKTPEATRGMPASAEKSIVSIRMPIEILNFIEGESRARAAGLGLRGVELAGAINITATINRMLEALRSWFGLPAMVAEAVEKDRTALGLGRLEYLQFLVFRRYEALVKNGPGFDRNSVPTDKGAGGRK
jgi:hypothetical protein